MAVDVDGDVLEAAQFAHDPGDADPGGVLEVVGDGQGGVTGAGGDEARASGLLLAGDDGPGPVLLGVQGPVVPGRRYKANLFFCCKK